MSAGIEIDFSSRRHSDAFSIKQILLPAAQPARTCRLFGQHFIENNRKFELQRRHVFCHQRDASHSIGDEAFGRVRNLKLTNQNRKNIFVVPADHSSYLKLTSTDTCA